MRSTQRVNVFLPLLLSFVAMGVLGYFYGAGAAFWSVIVGCFWFISGSALTDATDEAEGE